MTMVLTIPSEATTMAIIPTAARTMFKIRNPFWTSLNWSARAKTRSPMPATSFLTGSTKAGDERRTLMAEYPSLPSRARKRSQILLKGSFFIRFETPGGMKTSLWMGIGPAKAWLSATPTMVSSVSSVEKGSRSPPNAAVRLAGLRREKSNPIEEMTIFFPSKA